MDKDLASRVEDFRKIVTSAGESIVFERFPKKGLNRFRELHELVESTSKPDSPFHQSHAESSTDLTIYPHPTQTLAESDDPQSKKRKRENGTIVEETTHATYPSQYGGLGLMSNQHISQHIHSRVKEECEQLASMIDEVKLWVSLTMPKIEDGDNFGVQIQEEVLGELHRAQESAYNLRDVARQDYLARAKICSKRIKYPRIEDYKLALQEHDEKQLYQARQHLIDIRNMYAVLTDLIHKNISKIRSPKANNSVALY